MPKTLFLLRHAKSSWKDLSIPDHDRKLNKRGLHDAPRMAAWMQESGHHPDWMICSTAVRTTATAEALETVFGQSIPLEFEERLYMASPGKLIQCITKKAPEVHSAIAVGHNPGLEDLAYSLVGEPIRIPTMTLVSISLPLDHWVEFSSQTRGTLNFVMRPKMLP